MRIRLYNAKILTMKEERIIKGEMWINDGRIEYIGGRKRSEQRFQREMDLHGNLIMPGFKNAHAHSPMTFARSRADDLPLDKWLNEKIFPMEAKLTQQHIYYYSKLAYMEYLSSGITAAFDMYCMPEVMSRASIETGFRTVICGEINNFTDSIESLDANYSRYNSQNELISYILGFHAEYTTDLSILKRLGKLAEKHQSPVYGHNSETEKEVANCIAKYGMTPTKLFAECGLFDYGGGGFHCVYLSDEDMEIFKEKGLYAVLNAGANLKLASGFVPAGKYQKAGMHLAMGTDGPSGNNALDMFREMYILTVLQKVLEQDAAALKAYHVLQMATIGSAKAMGLQDCDVLAEGKRADLIVVDLKAPNMQPENNLINNLVYAGGKQNVCMTMINGKILYENGEYKTIDAEEVYYYANKLLKGLMRI